MNIYITLISLFTLMFYTGCKEIEQPQPSQKIEIKELNQKVQELDVKDKQLIYRSIQNEINLYNKKGDEAYENGYNYDAITAYEMVNFYEGYSYIPLNKIDKIKQTAKVKSIYHYNKALKYTDVNNKKAVIEFNKVMMNDPKYKDSSARLNALNEDREIKIFINSLESSLHTDYLNNMGTTSDLKSINSQLNKLLKYDYQNSVALKAKDTLDEYRKKLLHSAIGTYKIGDTNKAKKKFNSILSIYGEDSTADEYLKKIKIEQSGQKNLKLAQKALNKKEYMKSIKYAQKVLKIDNKNKEAKEIIVAAKRESQKKVKSLIKEGKDYYNARNLDEAKHSFQEVLKIDPDNNTSLIYSKKISRQLETIKSLE